MEELEPIHKYMKNTFSEYVCIIAVGSIVTGDHWIKGRSDKDFLIIFNNLPQDYIANMSLFFSKMNFDETYTFVPMKKSYWIKNKHHSHDFSGKFRSKIIFGENILPQKELPSKEETLQIYTEGLEDVKQRILRTLVNEKIWSEKKIRDIFWKLFKHGFMYLAIKYYYDMDIYPQSRKELVELTKSEVLEEVLLTLYQIDYKNKIEILTTATNFLAFISS
tara:strand:- start:879 stop:1538 length:660 start_codon:yes stop_codon:yes gene_type:complete